MSIPFYGGQNGQSFKITAKFDNFKALREDANKGWNSSACMVGDYAVVDYGTPNTAKYAENRVEDSSLGYYNATVWQKIYTELTSSTDEIVVGMTSNVANGIGYKLLFYVSVPPTLFHTPTLDVVNASVDPSVSMTPEDQASDEYTIHFILPKAWDWKIGSTTWTNPDVNVVDPVIVDEEDEDGEKTGNKILSFTLPYSQDLTENTPVIYLDKAAGSAAADASLNKSTPYDSRHPRLELHLPITQEIRAGTSSDASSGVALNIVGPADDAQVAVDFAGSEDDIALKRYPKITFTLPRAGKYTFGELLKQASDVTAAAEDPSFEDLDVGDFYVNTNLAAVHEIIDKPTTTSVITEYRGTFQLPIPTVGANGIDPYDANGVPVTPTISRTPAEGPVETWQLNFGLPKVPKIEKSFSFVASTAAGNVNATASGDTLTFTFAIPAGTRLYAGVPQASITDAKDGDLYLANDTSGNIYEYDGTTQQWSNEPVENIKGAHGDNLVVLNSSAIAITSVQVPTFSYPAIGAYIEANYSAYANPASNQVVNVSYTPAGEIEFRSYWLYKTNGVWGGVKLTGDASNSMIVNDDFDPDAAAPSDETDKAYSTHYVNSLVSSFLATISNLQDQINDLKDALKQDIEEQQSWGNISDLPDKE